MKQSQDYTWIRSVREALLAAELVEPPAWVRQRAERLFRAPAQTTLIDRVRATLIFDSRQRQGLAPAGMRAMGVVDGPWQLLYRGGDVDVDLLVRPNQDGRTLNVRGQALSIVGASIESGTVEAMLADVPRPLHANAQASARTQLAPSGEFALSNLERGRYDVLLRLGAREIELTDLEL
jgi:hypothetical protein